MSSGVQPSDGPMLTCGLCGITSRSSRWGYVGTTEPVGLASRRCPSCDRWSIPSVSTPDHGQRTDGTTASTHPTKHELGVPPTATERRHDGDLDDGYARSEAIAAADLDDEVQT